MGPATGGSLPAVPLEQRHRLGLGQSERLDDRHVAGDARRLLPLPRLAWQGQDDSPAVDPPED